MTLPGGACFSKVGNHVPPQPTIKKGDEQRQGNEWHMLAEQSAEEEVKGQSVNHPAGANVPSGLPDEEGDEATPNPNGVKDVGRNVAIEIKQTPRKEKQGKRVGE